MTGFRWEVASFDHLVQSHAPWLLLYILPCSKANQGRQIYEQVDYCKNIINARCQLEFPHPCIPASVKLFVVFYFFLKHLLDQQSA